MRISVRMIASALMYASYGKKTNVNALWASGRPNDCRVTRKCMPSGKSTGL